MDFISAADLLRVCGEENITIADAMRERENTAGESNPELTESKMKKALNIMRE